MVGNEAANEGKIRFARSFFRIGLADRDRQTIVIAHTHTHTSRVKEGREKEEERKGD